MRMREERQNPAGTPHDPSLQTVTAAYCVKLGLLTALGAAVLLPLQLGHNAGEPAFTINSATVAIALAWTARWALKFKHSLRPRHSPAKAPATSQGDRRQP